MSNQNNGEFAFPIVVGDQMTPGMTLRDYFAAKALQGMLSDRNNIMRFDHMGKEEMVPAESLMATAAYQMADCMLAERARQS